MKLKIAALVIAIVWTPPAFGDVRIKDIVDIEGIRGNDLVGYGLVVGLNATGDGIKNSPYTEEAFASLLERLGVNVQGENFKSRNVAAVIVTAALPAFARSGTQVDVTVSAIGDATSLLGGQLIMTPLKAGDGQIYAVAQGPVLASGLSAKAPGASVTFGAPTSGSIPQGARVEREVGFELSSMTRLRLALRAPDVTTAMHIESVINRSLGSGAAIARDPGTIDVTSPGGDMSPIRLISAIENLRVEPEQRARIVIDQKSGTVVLGADVKISRFAVTQGNLSITVSESPYVSQPNPFSRNGDTIIVPNTDVRIETGRDARIGIVDEAISLSDLIRGLNALGVGPRELIDILTAIKAAGALHADIILL